MVTSSQPLSPPSGSFFRLPRYLPCLGGYSATPASSARHITTTIRARRAALVRKRHYGGYLAPGKRWGQFCLSARGLCSPRAKVTHFPLALVTPQALGSIEPSVFPGLLSRLPHRPAVLRPTRRPLFPRLFQVGASAMQPYSAWPDRAILTARTTREAR